MLQHWIWLSQRNGIGSKQIYSLLKHFGTAEKVYLAQKQDFSVIDGITRRAVSSLMDKNLNMAETTLHECQQAGISVMTLADAVYPQRLLNIPDPPCVLYYKGKVIPVDDEPVVAVVGTRRGTNYGLQCAKQFGVQLAGCGCVVASGGARGVDTLALRGAMNTGAPVICVLGCGVDVAYPSENAPLFEEIAENGWLLSEYGPGVRPIGANFPPRNRIISGLSVGVLVVEAAARSGALITANHALDQGRDVFAVPGNINTGSSDGTNSLLKDGAIVARCGWDVASEYQALFPHKIHEYQTNAPLQINNPSQTSRVTEHEERVESVDATKECNPSKHIDVNEILDELDCDEKTVVLLLNNGPMHINVMAVRCSLSAMRILSALTMLEIKKYVVQLPGKIYSLAERT